MNDETIFPELRKDQLYRYARRWVRSYPKVVIDRIVLYWYCPTYQKYYENELLIPVKYAIVFEISPCKPERGLSLQPFDFHQGQSLRKDRIEQELNWEARWEARWAPDAIGNIADKPRSPTFSLNVIPDAIDNFIADTEYFETLPARLRRTSKQNRTEQAKPKTEPFNTFVAFMDKGFESVYVQKPNGPFQEEWILIPKIPGDVLSSGIRTDEPYWILFPCESGVENFPQRVQVKEPDMILGVDVSSFTRVNGNKLRDKDRKYIEAALWFYENNLEKRFVFHRMIPDQRYVANESSEKKIREWIEKGKEILAHNNYQFSVRGMD